MSCNILRRYGGPWTSKGNFFINLLKLKLKLKCTVPAQGTLSAVFRIFDPKALDAGLGRLPADRNSELDAAINALSLIALKGKVLTANARLTQ